MSRKKDVNKHWIYEAARALRGSGAPQAKSIPIIAMTANVFAEDIQKCLDAGMNAHIAKPIEIKTLEQVLRKTIKRIYL